MSSEVAISGQNTFENFHVKQKLNFFFFLQDFSEPLTILLCDFHRRNKECNISQMYLYLFFFFFFGGMLSPLFFVLTTGVLFFLLMVVQQSVLILVFSGEEVN